MTTTNPRTQDSRRASQGPAIERLLFIADAAVADVNELPPEVRAEIDAAAEVYVVTPSLPGRLAWLADELNKPRHAADERLDAVLGQMRSIGVQASGVRGDDSILTAFGDAVAAFHPDHILIALHSHDHADWQERHLIERVHKRYGLPVTSFAIDPRGHVSMTTNHGATLATRR